MTVDKEANKGLLFFSLIQKKTCASMIKFEIKQYIAFTIDSA